MDSLSKSAYVDCCDQCQCQWIENETDRPLLLTCELDSFLNNQSDASLAGAVRDSEEIAVQVEKLGVKNHEVEWFEEDNMEEFEEDFRSDFASSLRESLPPRQPASNLATFHNDLMKKQLDKYDAMVIKTTKLLNAAETQKKHLRKTAKDFLKELEETRENWQGAAEVDAEEISSLKATVTAQKIRIEELELLTSEPDISNQKCGKCSFAAIDSKQLGKHMKQAHGQGKICTKCEQVFADETKLRKHKEKHHRSEWQFACEVCKNTFKTLNDAREHTKRSCASIKPKEVVIDIEELDDTHRCNACSISFLNNNVLEKHMEKEHQTDCTKCHASFKNQDDYYNHANNCSQVIEPLMCETCNIELISRAGLKRHTEKCQKKSSDSNTAFSEACTNGPDCRYFKEDRCHYQHDEPNNQPWERVQHRRQGRQNQRRQPFRQQQPQARQHSPRQHSSRQHSSRQHSPCQNSPRQNSPRQQLPRQKLPRQQLPRQQLQECRNGPECIFWKHDRCNFAHSGSRQLTGRGVDSRQQRMDLDSRQHRRNLDSSPRRQEDRSSQGKPCKFGAQCDRILRCGFLHSAKDFLSVQGQRRN